MRLRTIWCYLALLLVAAVQGRAGQTLVSSDIVVDTTWTLAGSPYVLSGSPTVVAPATLSIDPGVAVHIPSSSIFTIHGTLSAVGTLQDPITFSPEAGASVGGGIAFIGTGSSTMATGTLEHCAATQLQGLSYPYVALASSYAALTIRESSFEDFPNTVIRPLSSRVTITGCTFNNTKEAINLVNCAGILSSNTILNVNGSSDGIDIDLAWQGPGDPTLIIEGNVVQGGLYGDGVDFGSAQHVHMRNNIIRDFGDKGISVGEGATDLRIYNTLIQNCDIGVAIRDSSDPLISNLTVTDCNTGISAYEKYRGRGGGSGAVSNSIIWGCTTPISLTNGSTTTFAYCDVQGTAPAGDGNISTDPLFIDAAEGDLRLRLDSPCINVGNNQSWMLGATDLGGAARILGGLVDMGAYEADVPASFMWAPIPAVQAVDAPFPATITALDVSSNVLRDFTGSLPLSAMSLVSTPPGSIVITECELDYGGVEIQNVSTTTVDTSGWVLALNANTNDINDVNPSLRALPESISMGIISATSRYPPYHPFRWTAPGEWDPSESGWVLLLDNQGQVRDFVAWGWSESEIAAISTVVNGFPVSGSGLFTGNGLPLDGTGSIQRLGNSDNNASTDFAWVDPVSIGSQNVGLTMPFQPSWQSVDLSITPLVAGPFVSGIWSEAVTIHNAGGDAFLQVDAFARVYDSTTFDVVVLPFLDLVLPPSLPETQGTATAWLVASEASSSSLAITITSSDTTEVQVVRGWTLPAGATNLAIELTVIDDGLLDGSQMVVLSPDAMGYAGRSASATVHDRESATLQVYLPPSLSESDGLQVDAGQVRSDAAPAADIVVALTSDDVSTLTVPPEVVLLAGQTNVGFNITVIDNADIDGDRIGGISASVRNWVSGSNTVVVLDDEHTNLILQLPSQVVEDGGVLTNAGRVSIAGFLSSPLPVTLLSDSPNFVMVPSSVTIPIGATSVVFSLTIGGDSACLGANTVEISAAATGLAGATRAVVVREDDPDHFEWEPLTSPIYVHSPFKAAIAACDSNGTIVADFRGSASLACHSGDLQVVMFPTNTSSFVGGRWSGVLHVKEAVSNGYLRATDGAGHDGVSGHFAVLNWPAEADGLVLYYTFACDEGALITDWTGNGHTGTVHGATWVNDAIRGGAYRFDGEDYISTPHSDALNVSSGITVCAWINVPADFLESHHGIVSNQNDDDWNNKRGWSLMMPVSNRLVFAVNGPGVAGAVGGATATRTYRDGQWHHIISTAAGETSRIYVDGVELGEPLGNVASSLDSTTELRIGDYAFLGEMRRFVGMIDDVRIYNREVSDAEAKSIYMNTFEKPPARSGVVIMLR